MYTSGLFDGLEQEVNTSAQSIINILKSYPSSKAGKNLLAAFSGAYYHFYNTLWQGLESDGQPPSQLLKAHIVSRLHLDLDMLGVALYRSFRRALYCKCFNGIELAEMKQAGLYAYWIAKMRPIVIGKAPADLSNLSNDLERGLQEINERFAYHIVRLFYKSKIGRSLFDSEDYQSHFVHTLKYRSFTEDTMMLVTESLGVAGKSTSAPY